MSIDGYWPIFPKTINEKAWQKKKGIIKVKKTGISEEIAKAEKAYETLKPSKYSRISLALDTEEEAKESLEIMEGDEKTVNKFVEETKAFISFCNKKAKEFKASTFIPKAVGEYVEEMAADASTLMHAVLLHCKTARKDVERIIDSYHEDDNKPVAIELIDKCSEYFERWDRLFPGKMTELENAAKEVNLLERELEGRLSGSINKPAEDLKAAYQEVTMQIQELQDELLGGRSVSVELLRISKQADAAAKKIRGDKDFVKDYAIPYDKKFVKFLNEREEFNKLSSIAKQDASTSTSMLEKGLKNLQAVKVELTKFLEIYYEETSPSCVNKSREHIDSINTLAKEVAKLLANKPVNKDLLRDVYPQLADSVVKANSGIETLERTYKLAGKFTQGQFQDVPEVSRAMKRMEADLKKLQKEVDPKQKAFNKLKPLAENALTD